MTAKVHTVETLGAELLEAFPSLAESRHAETLARTLLAALEPSQGWRTAQLRRQVPAELRGRLIPKAKRAYGTVDTAPSDV